MAIDLLLESLIERNNEFRRYQRRYALTARKEDTEDSIHSI